MFQNLLGAQEQFYFPGQDISSAGYQLTQSPNFMLANNLAALKRDYIRKFNIVIISGGFQPQYQALMINRNLPATSILSYNPRFTSVSYPQRSAHLFCQDRIVQGMVTKFISDLLHDRHRDMRNLSLASDQIDTRAMNDILLSGAQTGLQPFNKCHEDLKNDMIVKSLLRDAKYNRRSSDIISSIATGTPYIPTGLENVQDVLDLKYDIIARQNAKQLMENQNRLIQQQTSLELNPYGVYDRFGCGFEMKTGFEPERSTWGL